MKGLRTQLFYTKEFILGCKEKDNLIQYLGTRTHLMTAPDLYSLQDFVDLAIGNDLVDSLIMGIGSLIEFVKQLSDMYTSHVKKCNVRIECVSTDG